jgi:hypothetical protein
MMQLSLKRKKFSPDYTLGELYLNGTFFCYTCEDAVRSVKIPGKTAIPAGRYGIIMNMSARFGKIMPLLLNVPGFDGVRIHAGNSAADTEGCILLGFTLLDSGVANSRAACAKLYPILQAAFDAKQAIWIDIQ